MNMSRVLKAAAMAAGLIVMLNLSQNHIHGADSKERDIEWPCTDRSAIQWIRDPKDCTQYYICHYGQPLSMPACPFGQVWAIKARNCVPENSRWNDCELERSSVLNGTEDVLDNPVTDDQGKERKYHPVSMSSTPESLVISVRPTGFAPRQRSNTTRSPSTKILFTPKQQTSTATNTTKAVKVVIRTTRTPLNGYGKHLQTKDIHIPTEERSENYDTQSPSVTSPFQPTPQGKYYTYVKENKPNMTKRPRKTPLSPRDQKETKPTKAPSMTAPTTLSTVTTTSPKINRVRVPPSTRQTARIFPKKKIPSLKSTPKTNRKVQDAGPSKNLKTDTQRKPIIKAHEPTATLRATTQKTPTQTPTMPTMMTEQTMRQKNGVRTIGIPTPEPSEWVIKPMQLRLPEGHPCHNSPGELVVHPKQCHWYYNCSTAALENAGGHLSTLVEECRYPQLFDTVTNRCREFINVQCEARFEPVDPCEYQTLQCQGANCIPCHNRYGSCRGKENGIYPFHTERWTPTFVTCYMQRNIAQDDCQSPSPIFSPDARDCVTLFDVPKQKGGLRPECSFRENGFYPDEQGRCGIFFECRDGEFVGYDECPLGTVFDPMTLRCQLLDRSTPPCGEGQDPSCADRHDGFHADPFGRCPYYFECRKKQFVRHLTCDFGSFDPVTQECVIATELIPQPCGVLPNPCQGKQSGFYPDETSNCQQYIECSREVMISKGVCPEGTVFSAISGRCDRPENAPEPCGLAPSCTDKEDGRYSALTRGCSFYFECRKERFAGLKQCSIEDGGFFFNEETGQCDFPQNICPPCGYKWWGCANTFLR